MSLVNSTYEHALARVFHDIDKRGILIDGPKLKILEDEILAEIRSKSYAISMAWGIHVFCGQENNNSSTGSINLNSPKALIAKLKDLGFKLPKLRTKNLLTRDIEFKDSSNELILRRVFAETSDNNIKLILDIRELNKMLTTYVRAKLLNNVFYSNYSVTGTVTGRRSSRKHIFNLGGNAQNLPKHSKLGLKFRECIIPRPGYIYFSVDQISAEEYPVSALAKNYQALDELTKGINRHRKLAAFIFGKPEASISKEDIEYFLGKKTRHANNYGMREQRMSDSLAQEGYAISKEMCKNLLEKVNNYDPSIKGVFHPYIKETISKARILHTPLGRERAFFGFRPNDENYDLWNEAFSYIPQSTVADNTGLAILHLSNCNNYVVQDGHDSILQEIPFSSKKEIAQIFKDTQSSFEREIKFENGISIKIPIEAEIGFNLKDMVKLKEFTESCLMETIENLLVKNVP